MDNTSDGFLGLHDFLDRMRQPSAAEFVRSIKSFIVSFSNNPPDPERDSVLVQDFLAKMESSFRSHPLWSKCSEEELEGAGEGLEKYVMTKLFSRVFATSPDDIESDAQLSQKISLVQQFVLPENLDIKPTFQNESSWVLAQKELQKINMYKAPRDKLVCILTCCKVITNLLLNASMEANESPPGADEFLPVLIYVTIKANPPNLHSNLAYISRYRRQSKLVAESAYFLTNMLSAESFIANIDAKSLSMAEDEFEKHMELSMALASDVDELSDQILRNVVVKEEPKAEKKVNGNEEPTIAKIPSLTDIENRGAAVITKEESHNFVFREYPYLHSSAGDLTIADVDDLLTKYKELVVRYVCLSKGLDQDEQRLKTDVSDTDSGAMIATRSIV